MASTACEISTHSPPVFMSQGRRLIVKQAHPVGQPHHSTNGCHGPGANPTDHNIIIIMGAVGREKQGPGPGQKYGLIWPHSRTFIALSYLQSALANNRNTLATPHPPSPLRKSNPCLDPLRAQRVNFKSVDLPPDCIKPRSSVCAPSSAGAWECQPPCLHVGSYFRSCCGGVDMEK